MNEAILDGNIVEASKIDAGKHRYLGMFREPFGPKHEAPFAYRPPYCPVCIRSGEGYVTGGWLCYTAGHYDIPQYVTIIEEKHD